MTEDELTELEMMEQARSAASWLRSEKVREEQKDEAKKNRR